MHRKRSESRRTWGSHWARVSRVPCRNTMAGASTGPTASQGRVAATGPAVVAAMVS